MKIQYQTIEQPDQSHILIDVAAWGFLAVAIFALILSRKY
jgi:hypothetical protein